MKTSKKTKKIFGGVAIAAVSLGCLGLAGIANAATPGATSSPSGSASSVSPATGAYDLSGTDFSTAVTGTTTLTVNVSVAQGESLSDHNLTFYKIGDYLSHASAISLSATDQAVENTLYGFATASAADGGLEAAYPSVSYTSSDGEALNWLVTGNNSGTYLGTDATGQSVNVKGDYATRLLANWLYSKDSSLTPLSSSQVTKGNVSTSKDGYQEQEYTIPAGVYLVVDTTTNGNEALPMIVATTLPSTTSYSGALTNFMTSQIALKDQDPQATPTKQFVTQINYGAVSSTATGGDLEGSAVSGSKLVDSLTATVGSANAVTYQIANVLPNFNGYAQYSYEFTDTPGTGMTLDIAKGQNMYIAGLPISSVLAAGNAATYKTQGGATVNNPSVGDAYLEVGGVKYGDTSTGDLSGLTSDFTGNGTATMEVVLNKAAMEYIIQNGYQTSNNTASGAKTINFAKFTSNAGTGTNVTPNPNAKPAAPISAPGVGSGASSYTGQTVKADSGANANKSSATYPQAQGELFGLTYQAYLNSSVPTSISSGTAVTEASNKATTGYNTTPGNTGSKYQTSGPASTPLQSSGGYNGGTKNQQGGTGNTVPVTPGNITGTNGGGKGSTKYPDKTTGVPNKSAVGAGISWMKIDNAGQAVSDTEFQVSRVNPTTNKTQYLYSTGSGWAWANSSAGAETFQSVDAQTAAADKIASDAVPGLFEINGLADGTYTVTEVKTNIAEGYDPNALPSFTVTLTAGQPEVVSTSSASLGLVNNTPGGNPFFSGQDGFNTVENVKSLAGLPLTGGAGILTGVIAAVLLFGTAGIVLVVYKRRKSQREE